MNANGRFVWAFTHAERRWSDWSHAFLFEGLDLVANRERYSLRELLGTLAVLKKPELRAKENRLAQKRSVYCSAFVKRLFERLDMDRVPGGGGQKHGAGGHRRLAVAACEIPSPARNAGTEVRGARQKNQNPRPRPAGEDQAALKLASGGLTPSARPAYKSVLVFLIQIRRSFIMKPAGVFWACRLCIFCLGALFHCSGAFAATDDEIVANFRKEGARLRAEIAAERTDIARIHALQLEMKALLERTVAQVSEPLRSVLRITYQIVNPLMEESIGYNALVQAKAESGVFDYSTATSDEIIEQRLKEIGELETSNTAFAKRLDSFDADMEKTLNESRLRSSDREDLLERFRKQLGRRMAAMRATRTLEAAIYGEMREIYGLQRENFGKWSVKEGQIVFQEKVKMEAFVRHTSRMNELEARQDKARDVARKISPAPAP